MQYSCSSARCNVACKQYLWGIPWSVRNLLTRAPTSWCARFRMNIQQQRAPETGNGVHARGRKQTIGVGFPCSMFSAKDQCVLCTNTYVTTVCSLVICPTVFCVLRRGKFYWVLLKICFLSAQACKYNVNIKYVNIGDNWSFCWLPLSWFNWWTGMWNGWWMENSLVYAVTANSCNWHWPI